MLLTTNNGVCVLQTGDIDLAFTDSYDEAKEAQQQIVGNSTVEPYNCQHQVVFSTDRERNEFMTELRCFLGNYLENFIVCQSDDDIVLRGFCLI